MSTRRAESLWEGGLTDGSGTMILEASERSDARFSFASRLEGDGGTTPEDLIAAADAGCYSLALSHELSEAGYEPESVRTVATIHLADTAGGFAIARIELNALVAVEGIGERELRAHARRANRECPVSKALGGVEVVLTAHLAR